MKHHNQKANWGGKGLFILYFIVEESWDKNSKQGRNLEAAADAEAREGCSLTAWLLNLLSYRTQEYLPKDDSTHSELNVAAYNH